MSDTPDRKRGKNVLLMGIVIALAGLASAAVYALSSSDRTYAISAQAGGVEIEFAGTNRWRLEGATLCQRLPKRRQAPDNATGLCDPKLFEESSLSALDAEFRDGAQVSLIANENTKALEIHVSRAGTPGSMSIGDITVSGGSLLYVLGTAWRDSGTLPFSGKVIVGAVAGPGNRKSVYSGRYEIRQQMLRGDETFVVREGEIFPGDSLRIVPQEGQADETVHGFILPEDHGLLVQAVSGMGRQKLRIDRLGSQYAFLEPRWFDRILKDPEILALSSFGALFLALWQFVAWFWRKD